MSVHFRRSYGQYNWASSEKQWLLELITPFGKINQLFDEEPAYGDSVEDVLEVLAARVESWWVSTSREADRASIAAIRERLPECELIYAKSKIEKLRRKLADTQAEIKSVENLISALECEIAEAGQ